MKLNSENCEVIETAKILIVDDHPMVREGLAACISKHPHLVVCGEADDVAGAMREVAATKPDLVIVDISLKSGNGIDLIKQIKAKYGDSVKMLVASMHDESLYAQRAMQAGAMGYVNKQEMADTVIDAINRVLDGKLYLSPETTERLLQYAVGGSAQEQRNPAVSLSVRELEVFGMIGQGLTTSDIAKQLKRSIHTIDTHREKIKKKLLLKNAAQLHRAAVQWVLENE